MAHERVRRAEAMLLSARRWREQPASMRWLLGVNVVLAIVFAAHLVEETWRGAIGTFEWLYLVGPVLVLLVVGIAMVAAGNIAGVGVLFGMDGFLAAIASGSHLTPASPDYFLTIASTWGGATGWVWGAVAVLLPLVAILGFLAGVWALMDAHDRVAVVRPT